MTSYNPASPDFPFTIGIEEEYQVVDPQTRELRSYITQILDRGKMILREQIKPELHQSMGSRNPSMPHDPGGARRSCALAQHHCRSCPSAWIDDHFRRNSPDLILDESGDHPI
jgi:hypothetical protein